MKALLLSKYKHLEIADLPEPKAGPGEVLVRVAACGICGSDVHGYDGSSGRLENRLDAPGQKDVAGNTDQKKNRCGAKGR